MPKKRKIISKRLNKFSVLVFVILFGGIASILIFKSLAANSSANLEAENGTITSPAQKITDAAASGGSAIQFKSASNGPPIAGNWNQVFSDEFNDTSVDTTKWNIQNNSNYGAGNNEDECYLTGNSTESNGALHLTAIDRRTNPVTCGTNTNPDGGNSKYYFSSGMITTGSKQGTQKFAITQSDPNVFKPVYLEASIKSPKGNPFWGAFWLVGGDGAPSWPSYGEIDILESYGWFPDSVTGTFHYSCTSGTTKCSGGYANTTRANIFNLVTGDSDYNEGTVQTLANLNTYNGPTTSQFVRLGMYIESSRITWYVNGIKVRSFDGQKLLGYRKDGSTVTEGTVGVDMPAPNPSMATMMRYPKTIILNLAVGGDGPAYDGYTGNETSTGYSNGNIAANFPQSLDVDYVRVWQQ